MQFYQVLVFVNDQSIKNNFVWLAYVFISEVSENG